ncbi:MAG: GGDEF domain-containing protein [Burkholderiales bacterium]|nr:GGDEF domain-containing protein [Burkholderiales bacterium]
MPTSAPAALSAEPAEPIEAPARHPAATRARGAARLTLLALAVYGLFAGSVWLQVRLGLMAATPAAWYCAVSLLGIGVFYGLVRSGLSLRLSPDRSMTMAQSVFGVLMTTWGYAIDAPLRGAIVAIMLLNLVWGMFVLSSRQALSLCLLALGLLAATMVWKSRTDALNYPPVIEAFHFFFCAVLLSAMSMLSISMGRLRHKLTTRTAALQAALEKIQTLARVDELTQLHNRRHLGELLAVERNRQARSGQPLTMIMLDLDHFKAVNDSHGHAAGDTVLRRFAASIRPLLRGGDLVGRWGGEEFLLVMPGTPVEAGVELVQRLRQVLRQLAFDDIAPGLRMSFSAGVTACAPGEPTHLAVERADRALYRAKAEGRGRTAIG